jgi:beta-glucosidase
LINNRKKYCDMFQESQKGSIGMSLVAEWVIPNSETRQDKVAALRSLDFIIGWYMDPLTNGDYPKIMKSLVGDRLPKFTKEESTLLKGSFDFIGLNYYTSTYVSDAPQLRTVANESSTTDSLTTTSCKY